MSEPIRVGGSYTCKQCGQWSDGSDVHFCKPTPPPTTTVAHRFLSMPRGNWSNINKCKAMVNMVYCDQPRDAEIHQISTTTVADQEAGEDAPSFFEARIRNQAENITHEVFGYPASAVIGRFVIPLRESITAALLAAHASTQPEDDRQAATEENHSQASLPESSSSTAATDLHKDGWRVVDNEAHCPQCVEAKSSKENGDD